MEANKELISELEMIKHDKEAEIKIVEKKTSGLVTMHCVLLLLVFLLWSDKGPASSGTTDATERGETTATTKQHKIERLYIHYMQLCIHQGLFLMLTLGLTILVHQIVE